jgi:hypothetical protein
LLTGRVPGVVVGGFGNDLDISNSFLSVLFTFNGLRMFEVVVASPRRRVRVPSMGLDGMPDPDLMESILSNLKMEDVFHSPWFARVLYE